MSVLRRILASLLIVLAALGLSAAPAHAKGDKTPSSWHIVKHDTTVRFDKDGTGHARTTIDFDFSDDEGHGPYLVFVTRMRVAGNPDVWRDTPVVIEKVTSPSGAPTDLKVEEESGSVKARIGSKDIEVKGVQTYVVDYRVRGLISPKNTTSSLDEVNWSVVGTGWQVPIERASATIEMPASVSRAACFSGDDFSVPCQASPIGSKVIYNTSRLSPGDGMQIVAGVPSGTFVGAEPTFSKRYHVGTMFATDPAPMGVGGLLALIASGGILGLVRRHGRDEVFAGLTPGLAPTSADGATTRVTRHGATAVRFSPPDQAFPGEIGTLIDERADQRDVVATIVDLAVRGHIRITPMDPEGFFFERLASNEPMQPWEHDVCRHFFGGGTHVSTTTLGTKAFAEAFPKSKEILYQQVTQGRQWFRTSPDTTRTGAGILAFLLFVGAAVGTFITMWFGWGLAGLALFIPAIVMTFAAPHMPARTAAGSAALAQARGFELYLRTAEAGQIRWEEGQDIFSRYLPWAIAFNVADRWVAIFERLAAQGYYDLSMTSGWYCGYGYGYGFASFNSISQIDSSVSSAMDHAVSEASSASSGGSSGFSGGGGFGGGGGGGW